MGAKRAQEDVHVRLYALLINRWAETDSKYREWELYRFRDADEFHME